MKIEFAPDRDLYPFRVPLVRILSGTDAFRRRGSRSAHPAVSRKSDLELPLPPHRGLLADRFRCVAVDYLRFGLSDRPHGYGCTIEEHARTVGELVDHLSLDGFVLMGQDWGGPFGTAVAVDRADRVRGRVLGNTRFWPSDAPSFKAFSTIMGSGPIQRQVLEHNVFVERLMTLPTRSPRPSSNDSAERSAGPPPRRRLVRDPLSRWSAILCAV